MATRGPEKRRHDDRRRHRRGGTRRTRGRDRCARLGLATTLFDEQPALGGQIHRGVAARRDAGEPTRDADDARGLALVDALRASTAAHVADAAVWSARAMPDATVEIGVTVRAAGTRRGSCAPARPILATGAIERPFPMPGWTLPGVMTAGGAQILLKTSGLVPQGRIVLAGTGPLLWLAAAQLQDAGATIDALLETTPRGRLREALAHAPAFLLSPYFRRGLDLARRVRRRTRVVEFVTALAAEGGAAGVDAVRYVADGAEHVLPVDHLLLHQGVVPSIDLAGAAGCALAWNAQAAAFEPVVDAWGGTSVPSLFVTGDGAGIAGAEAAAARGALTALAVANALAASTVPRGTARRRRCGGRWPTRSAAGAFSTRCTGPPTRFAFPRARRWRVAARRSRRSRSWTRPSPVAPDPTRRRRGSAAAWGRAKGAIAVSPSPS